MIDLVEIQFYLFIINQRWKISVVKNSYFKSGAKILMETGKFKNWSRSQPLMMLVTDVGDEEVDTDF